MSVKNFRFVSPGVFVNEIDNSHLPASPVGIGPVVIGRAEKGPALRPVTVNSFSEFVQKFGTPSPGEPGDDVWRAGNNKSAPTYGMYAAQAYLRNSSPLTYIRLLGTETTAGTLSAGGQAGWKTDDAWGIFIAESGSADLEVTGALAAIIYTNGTARPVISGSLMTNGAAIAATGSITCISGAAAQQVGSTIKLDHYTSGRSYTFTSVSSSNDVASANQYAIGAPDDSTPGTSATFATNLAAVINASASADFAASVIGTTMVQIQGATGSAELTGEYAVTGTLSATVRTATTLGAVFTWDMGSTMNPNPPGTDSGASATQNGRLTGGSAATGIAVSSLNVTGTNYVVADDGTRNQFRLIIQNYKGTDSLTTTFNLDENSPRYLRKVLNTNPQQSNSGIVEDELNYFLGETFDRHVSSNINATSDQTRTMATILKLYKSTSTVASASVYQDGVQNAQTPWVTSGELGSGISNLFKFHALDQQGDWTNKNLKVSISDIKVSTNDATDYGTFSVVIRHLSDSDNVVRIVEQFDNCDLNPNSLNYIARKIGDRYRDWDEDERRYIQKGDWPNNSDFVRVQVSSDIDAGIANASFLPFGWRGIVKYTDEANLQGAEAGNWVTGSLPDVSSTQIARGPGDILVMSASNGVPINAVNGTLLYPAPEFRVNASDGNLSNVTDAYFGLQTTKTAGGSVFAPSTIDTLRPRGGAVGNMFSLFQGSSTSSGLEASMAFSLDDLSGSAAATTSWQSGSFAGGTSWTATNGYLTGVLDQGFDRFTVPLFGGFDGVDVTEMDAFANRNIPTSSPSDQNSYVFNSIRRTIDAISDPEVVEMNLAAVPGLTQAGLTTNLINVCEDRGDALAVIDLPDAGYVPRQEGTAAARKNTGSNLRQVISALRSRGLNSSYGCTFYPWVRGRDSINGAFVWLPPSIAALGTFSSSQRKTQVWFAPAGFNRGGLTEGSAGIPITDVAHQLRRKDRDDLYSANINPIAKFPAEGIVIFGQKTLQVTPSALDRINVRRLMIFVKKRISQLATTILFDPNVPTTWARFKSVAVPFLEDVRTNFGLSDFRLVLDGTTTTPDLIDRNILYARIYLKPTRAIEFIAIDFNITRTGASFED